MAKWVRSVVILLVVALLAACVSKTQRLQDQIADVRNAKEFVMVMNEYRKAELSGEEDLKVKLALAKKFIIVAKDTIIAVGKASGVEQDDAKAFLKEIPKYALMFKDVAAEEMGDLMKEYGESVKDGVVDSIKNMFKF